MCRDPIRRSSPDRLAATALVVAITLGCGQVTVPAQPAAPDVPFADAAEIAQLLASSDQPTLLEFCVPVGCARCEAMREPINGLALRQTGQLHVRRVNLNFERDLAARLGVSVCPTYVVVAAGKEVGRAPYPTSADLVEALIPDSHVKSTLAD